MLCSQPWSCSWPGHSLHFTVGFFSFHTTNSKYCARLLHPLDRSRPLCHVGPVSHTNCSHEMSGANVHESWKSVCISVTYSHGSLSLLCASLPPEPQPLTPTHPYYWQCV
uniref:Uncharacterized protein n=1 Tax=Myripristis murdjan TaxID=586833 RepID=A0A667X7H5_9TELE